MDSKCRAIQGEVELFLSDRLHGVERQDFIAHVANCKDCRDELEFYHVIYSVVDQLDNDTGSEDFNYISSLDKKVGLTDTKDKGKLVVRLPVIIAGVAGLGLVIAGLLMLFN